MKLLHEKAYFDYTEIINLAVQFLEGDPTRTTTRRRSSGHIRDDIRYVVVDEYQDVNPLQERLVRGLTQFGANLCVVGDDDQTIYQWRGSEVSNIVTFADRYAGVRQVTLADNFRSSEGVVELGRSVAERIPAGERLPKAMVRGRAPDLGARRPARARLRRRRTRRRRGSATASRRLRGVAVPRHGPTAEPRGLSWSDCAVLFRSVAKDADPLVAELRRRGIPFVVKGLNRLFDSPEITGRRRHLPLHGRPRSTAHELRALWAGRDLLPAGGDWAAALAVLDEGRDFDRGRALGRLQHPAALPRLPRGARHARGDACRATPVRRELVFYQLGKFSQAISDFEQIHFNTEPSAEVRGVRELARVPGARLLRGVGRRRRLRHTRRRHDRDRAPGQGDAVAGGLPPVPAQEPLPVEAARRARPLPRHPGRRDRRCRPLPGHGRGRDAALLRRRHPRAEVPVRVVLARREPALQASGRTSSTTVRASSGSRPGHRRAGRRAAARAAGPRTRRRRSRSRSRS